MEQKYLIDTNVIIDFSQNNFSMEKAAFVARILNNSPIISAITQIELLGFSVVPQQIVEFVDMVTISPISNSIILKTIELRKQYRIKLPDAIIAATAIFHNLTLLTRNTDDFKNIVDLEYRNPWI